MKLIIEKITNFSASLKQLIIEKITNFSAPLKQLIIEKITNFSAPLKQLIIEKITNFSAPLKQLIIEKITNFSAPFKQLNINWALVYRTLKYYLYLTIVVKAVTWILLTGILFCQVRELAWLGQLALDFYKLWTYPVKQVVFLLDYLFLIPF